MTRTPQQPSDDEARARIRGSLNESLIVEAAAGTGKTSELVRRIVAVLAMGAEVGGIVAVTFTRKAAGELKLRLRQALDEARTEVGDARARSFLERALLGLEEAHIGTIHAFCADILRDRPVEAGLQPGFEEIDEKEALRLFNRVFNRWAQETLSAPPAGLRRALDRIARWDFSDRTPLEQIRNAAWRLIEWRDFPAPWRREALDRHSRIGQLVDQVVDLAQAVSGCPKPKDGLRQALEPTLQFHRRLERLEAVRARDFDDLEASLGEVARAIRFDKRKGRGSFSAAHTRQEILEKRERLIESLDDFMVSADADLAALLQEEFQGLSSRYETAKRQAGKLDFADLLISTRDLIRASDDVRDFLQRKFTHIFVDEFQDTDPLQAEILLLLSSDASSVRDWRNVTPVRGKLFLVGDPKQSIYRFRRADFAFYRSLRERLAARDVGLVHLSRSFRAVPGIQKAVNAAFEPEMHEDALAGQPGYVGLEQDAGPIDGQPSVIALPAGRPYGAYRVTKTAVEACLPDTVGSFVEWLLDESGWRVRDLSGPSPATIPIAPRHICILFRRFVASRGQDVTRPYAHALEQRNVPHLLWGARSFHRREEVETIRAALMAIEWPDDGLSVYATLRGSLFSLSDSILLRYRDAAGRLHPFAPPVEAESSGLEPVREALDILARLHRRRNRQPFVETIHDLMEATRAHPGFALRPAGNQVLANVYRIAHLAREFESRGSVSFRGFVEQLTSDRDNEDRAESPVLEEGADGVRMMTVHAAKGLEFPVVVLADITARQASGRPDKHVDPDQRLCAMRLLGCSPWDLRDHESDERRRDEAEGVRIAYVAATRARDLLVVPVVGDEPLEGWCGSLNKALYPRAARRRNATTAQGCPSFGPRSVLDRPAQLMSHEEQSVQPGLHRVEAGVEVVWWDPSLLKLDVAGSFGIPRENLLAGTAAPEAARSSVAAYQSWRRELDERLERGAAPELEVFTAAEAESRPEPEIEVETLHVERDPRRPSGPRFGTLVHLVLRDSVASMLEVDVEALAALHQRALDATAQERDSARDAAIRAMEHPIMKRAAASPESYREYPVTVRTGTGAVLEGVIDLIFLENGVWHIVDFKTDVDIESRRRKYETQLNWYGFAVARTTGVKARGYLLGV